MTQPLNIVRFANRACDSLTVQQVDSLGLTGLNRLSATNLCRWSEGEVKDLNSREFNVSFATKMNPLALAYQAANNGLWPVFEPLEIGGFPAVKRQIDTDPPVYMCQVIVATGPSQGIDINAMSAMREGPAIDWCGKAITAAGYVIGALRS